jgi:hypothetical protein
MIDQIEFHLKQVSATDVEMLNYSREGKSTSMKSFGSKNNWVKITHRENVYSLFSCSGGAIAPACAKGR